jgi:hypothetical protein
VDGWIFANDGTAFAAVAFLDGGHVWDQSKTTAWPANHAGQEDTTRILIHAGDIASHGSFERFRETILAHPPEVTAGLVDYCFGKNRIVASAYDARSPQAFTLPLINGNPVELNPEAAYESPFLNGKSGGTRFTITVPPIQRTLDFQSNPAAAQPSQR